MAALLGAGAVAVAAGLAGCGSTAHAAAPGGKVEIVAAENEYGDVASQIGGQYASVFSVESNPNTDPHTYEVSTNVARRVATASLVIQNGIGYDDYMTRIESAASNSKRQVINVQHLLAKPDSTPNPHLWYDPATMPAVAKAIAADLATADPVHAPYFQANVTRFDASLQPWSRAIADFRAKYGGTPAATTEPVADYLLQAMGIDNLTPFGFQADIMNGTDPTPQDVALENRFFAKHQVRVFAYNQQVVSSLTQAIRANAQKAGVAVVGVYETMPTPGYDYQSWMLAETQALQKAVLNGTSTLRL